MKLKGRYGLSWVLINYQDALFYFYMFDVPFFSACKVLGIIAAEIDLFMSIHVLLKGVIVAIMTAESVLSHLFGPTVTRARKKKPDNYVDVSKAPFKSPLRENRPEPQEKAQAT